MHSPSSVEIQIVALVQWLKLSVELVGVALVMVGVLIAVSQMVRGAAWSGPLQFNAVRLTLARYLAMALEFQLGADVLATAVSPDWDHLGKLGAVAVIRTGLNFFLTKEIRDEQQRETKL